MTLAALVGCGSSQVALPSRNAVAEAGPAAARAGVSPAPRAGRVTVGDLNGSGTLDPGDTTKILRVIVGLDPAPANPRAMDLNGSGAIDPGDGTRVLRTVVGLDETLRVPAALDKYWPLAVGDRRLYREGAGSGSQTVLAQTTIGSQPAFKQQISTATANTYEYSWIDPTTLRLNGWDAPGTATTTRNSPAVSWASATFLGQSQTAAPSLLVNGTSVGTAQLSLVAEGYSAVTVPAGLFSDCLQVVRRVVGSTATDGTVETRLWLARGVGVVLEQDLAGHELRALTYAKVGSGTYGVPPSNGLLSAWLRQDAPGQNPSVWVGWSDADFVPPANYRGGYVVYRGVAEAFAALTGDAVGVAAASDQHVWSDVPTWVDQSAAVPVSYVRDGRTVSATVDTRIIHISPQPGQTYYYKVRRLGPPGMATAPTWPEPARRTRQVTAIPPGAGWDNSLDPAVDNSFNLGADAGLSTASAPAGPVTYLVPPELLAPADANTSASPASVRFLFQGVLGATQYQVQLATNAACSPALFEAAMSTTATGQLAFVYDPATPGHLALAAGTQYFWRVGAKCTFGGQHAPLPDGYVYSQVHGFQTADVVPDVP